MAYLLDANVFIRSRNLEYGFDFCPAFWDWVGAAHANGKLYSVHAVLLELKRVDDELASWSADRDSGFFLPPDSAATQSFAAVSSWVADRYTSSAMNEFLQTADYFLVAQAHAGRHTVVTHEKPSGSTKRVKIPDVCQGLGIPCVLPYTMLREERARFVLPVVDVISAGAASTVG